ncbi:MAG: MFS transporter [Alphaproteobacteria bacterium]|nr:MFS transporter [Alphaproteobacteria bacterium]
MDHSRILDPNFPMASFYLPRANEAAWYYIGLGAYFAGMGLQAVLFPWLVAVVLQLPATSVGFAQMLSMAPLPFLVLIGGARADRTDLRRQLMMLQSLVLVPYLGLSLILAFDLLSYSALIVYALSMGVLGAFVMPARDAALPALARAQGLDLTRAVTLATGAQFGGQLVGFAFAAQAEWTGGAPLMVVAAAMMGLALYATSRLSPQPPGKTQTDAGARSFLSEINEGLLAARRNPRVWPVITMLLGSSVLFMGVFMVVLPLLVRDVYGGSSLELALLNSAFMGGVMVTTLTLAQRRPIHFQGRTMMLSMGISFLAMGLMRLAPPEPLLYLLGLVWGGAAGVSMSMSRAIVQSAAAPEQRARIISIYQLAQMGGAPIGSLLIGFIISAIGVLDAILVPMAGIVILWSSVFFLTPLWRIEREEPAPSAAIEVPAPDGLLMPASAPDPRAASIERARDTAPPV